MYKIRNHNLSLWVSGPFISLLFSFFVWCGFDWVRFIGNGRSGKKVEIVVLTLPRFGLLWLSNKKLRNIKQSRNKIQIQPQVIYKETYINWIDKKKKRKWNIYRISDNEKQFCFDRELVWLLKRDCVLLRWIPRSLVRKIPRENKLSCPINSFVFYIYFNLII